MPSVHLDLAEALDVLVEPIAMLTPRRPCAVCRCTAWAPRRRRYCGASCAALAAARRGRAVDARVDLLGEYLAEVAA